MAYPFFSLAKTPRRTPINYRLNGITIRVEASPGHGMATIWDADILIWAASQIVAARNAGAHTPRGMTVKPYEVLRFLDRGTSMRDYHRLKAALDRLQATTVTTSLRQSSPGQPQSFTWIDAWTQRRDSNGAAAGIDLVLSSWFYQAVLNDELVLTIDRAYFGLTGGFERWLYRLVRKHAGGQRDGWMFEFGHLYAKSGSLSPFRRFAFELREMAHSQALPGYRLAVKQDGRGRETLRFKRARYPQAPVEKL